MRPMYYKRDGTPYPDDDTLAWAKDFSKYENKTVKKTILKNGMHVSTVWLGLDHNYGEGPPHIFETMVFPSENSWSDLACERYSTEAEAIAGHERICKEWGAKNADANISD